MKNEIKPEWNIDETKKMYWGKIRHPFNGGFEITQKCNFRCVHCYLQNGGYEKSLSTENVKLILDKLAKKGVLFLYLTGGEVFTRTDFDEIWLYAKSKGFVLEILTNASLVKPQTLNLFDEYPPAKISVSVYGANEETYFKVTGVKNQYKKVVKTLRLFKEHGLLFEIKFIGMRENIQDFYAVKQLAEQLGVEFSHSFELFPAFGGTQNLAHMLTVEEIVAFEKNYAQSRETWEANASEENFYQSHLEKRNSPLFACECGTTTCIVDAEGYLYPCNKLRFKKYNLLNCSFDDAWEAYGKIKKMPAPKTYPCLTCKNISVCNPCPAQNFLATGNYMQPDKNECALTALRNKTFGNKPNGLK